MGDEQESVASNYRHLVQSSVGSPATLRRDEITLDGVDMFVQVKTVPVENDEEATSPNDARRVPVNIRSFLGLEPIEIALNDAITQR